MSSSSSSNIVRVADGEEQNEERKKQKTVLHGAFFMGFAERYQHSKYDEAIAGLDIPSKAKQEGFVSFTSVCLDDNRDPMHQDNLLLEMGGLQAVKEKLRDLGFQCEDGQFDHGHDLYVWNESERTMGLEVKCNTGSFSGQGNRSASRFAIVCYWEHNSVQFSLWEGKKQYKSIKRDGTDEMVEDCFRISHLYGNGEVSAQNIKSILAESGQIGELCTVEDHHKEILNKSKNPKFKVGVNGELLVARFFSDFGETLTRRVVLNPFNLTNTDAVAIVLDNNKLRFSKISVKCANRAFPYKHKDAGVCFKFTYQLFSCCEMHCFVLLPGENDTPIPITKQPNPVQKPSIFFLAKEEFATNEEKETGLRITNFQIQRLKEAGRMFEVEHATRAACEPLMQLVFHGEGVREFNFFVGPSNYHLAGSKPEIPDLPFLGFVGEVARLMGDQKQGGVPYMHSQLLNGRVYIMKFTVQKRLKPRGKAGLLNDEAQDAYWLLYNDAECDQTCPLKQALKQCNSEETTINLDLYSGLVFHRLPCENDKANEKLRATFQNGVPEIDWTKRKNA